MNPIIRADIDHILSHRDWGLHGKTVLITGASGFLCSYLVDVLSQTGCRIIAVDNLQTGLAERLSHHRGADYFQFIRHDVSYPLPYSDALDYIIHGAGIASPTFYRQFPLQTIDVNVNGTRHMLDLAQQATSMLYLSTSEIYGDPSIVPTPESYWGNVSPTGPRAPYDESKRLAETLCMTYFRLYETPVKIARPFNVYGPAQRLDDKRIIPDMMSALIEGSTIRLFSDGTPTRAFCYVRDAAIGLLHILLSDAQGEVFNVGNDQTEISMGALAKMVSEMGGGLPIEHVISADADYLTDNPQRRCPDISKMRHRFGWEPSVSLREGLERTFAAYAD